MGGKPFRLENGKIVYTTLTELLERKKKAFDTIKETPPLEYYCPPCKLLTFSVADLRHHWNNVHATDRCSEDDDVIWLETVKEKEESDSAMNINEGTMDTSDEVPTDDVIKFTAVDKSQGQVTGSYGMSPDSGIQMLEYLPEECTFRPNKENQATCSVVPSTLYVGSDEETFPPPPPTTLVLPPNLENYEDVPFVDKWKMPQLSQQLEIETMLQDEDNGSEQEGALSDEENRNLSDVDVGDDLSGLLLDDDELGRLILDDVDLNTIIVENDFSQLLCDGENSQSEITPEEEINDIDNMNSSPQESLENSAPPKKQRLLWCKLCDTYYFNLRDLRLHIREDHRMDATWVNRKNYATWDLEIARTSVSPPEIDSDDEGSDNYE